MGADQYHEPPEELSKQTRTFARICASMTEEAEAIGWYQQRLDVETDEDAKLVMEHALGEECKHFCMDLEFLMRHLEPLRDAGLAVLFKPGKIGYQDDEEKSLPAPGSERAQPDAAADWRL